MKIIRIASCLVLSALGILAGCDEQKAPQTKQAMAFPPSPVSVITTVAEPLPINPTQFMTSAMRYCGSNWFTNADAALMADLVRTGALDLSPWEPRVYLLERVNDALSDIKQRPGGFVNVVVNPWL